ncbi:esterase/lipase family protein [Pelagibaculum spongiae]|nr:hypothetical protein [Pelagibaculum spongiae]
MNCCDPSTKPNPNVEPCRCKPGAIALVFVPGIMGSRLRNTKTQEVVWDPAAGQHGSLSPAFDEAAQRNKEKLESYEVASDASFWTKSYNSLKKVGVGSYGKLKNDASEVYRQGRRKYRFVKSLAEFTFSDAADRKALLVNTQLGAVIRDDGLLEVDDGTDRYFYTITGRTGLGTEEIKSRGWGEISWDSYGNYLNFLEKEIACGDVARKFPGYKIQTYAVGYNWMLSNRDSGKRLKQRLVEIRKELSELADIPPEKVKIVVITHSMGGYVARSAAILDGAVIDKMIHGAMPTHGSPATYANAHHGYPYFEGLVLGVNGAEVSAILGFCQGGLELLPNQHYKKVDGTRDWLWIENDQGEKTSLLEGYQGLNIYEFYKDLDSWYSFVSVDLLMPDRKKVQVDYGKLGLNHRIRISMVKNFHSLLSNKFHLETLILFNEDLDIQFPSYDECIWSGNDYPRGVCSDWLLADENSTNKFFSKRNITLTSAADLDEYQQQVKQHEKFPFLNGHSAVADPKLQTVTFELKNPSAPGDGTVHQGAGNQLALGCGVKLPIVEGEAHQEFYDSGEVRQAVKSELEHYIEKSFYEDYKYGVS